jgi:hypothetical protein
MDGSELKTGGETGDACDGDASSSDERIARAEMIENATMLPRRE